MTFVTGWVGAFMVTRDVVKISKENTSEKHLLSVTEFASRKRGKNLASIQKQKLNKC
jgi:hypothetical protein